MAGRPASEKTDWGLVAKTSGNLSRGVWAKTKTERVGGEKDYAKEGVAARGMTKGENTAAKNKKGPAGPGPSEQ
jgi:hypothetical protein